MTWLGLKLRSAFVRERSRPRATLVDFEPIFARLVVSWVRSDDELFLLSPRTPPPLTVAKLLAWKQPGGHPFVYIRAGDALPCAYVELNRMPSGHEHWWIGHCLVAPEHRGNGVGRDLVRLALDEAFARHEAHRVSLIVFPRNYDAVRCYRRVGFSDCGDVFRQFDTRRTACRMTFMSIDLDQYLYRRREAMAHDRREDRQEVRVS